MQKPHIINGRAAHMGCVIILWLFVAIALTIAVSLMWPGIFSNLF